MVKQQQHTRGVANKNQVVMEQHTIADDSLLPASEELERLQKIDPIIISWIMSRTEKEQEHRHDIDRKSIKLAKKDLNITRTALWLAFTIAVLILSLGGGLVYIGQELVGTIFGGVGIFVVVQSFLKFGRK